MTGAGREARLWRLVVEHAHGAPVAVEHVCAAVLTVTGVDAVAVVVPLAAGIRETVHASDALAGRMEELALTLGEGPGIDAESGEPSFVPDLTAGDGAMRWPVFTRAALDAGVRAVFAFPLAVGAIQAGVLTLYRTRAGGLDPRQFADALGLVDTACAVLLGTGRREPPPAAAIDARPHQPEVHQATGMITVQLGVSAAVALLRLRAYAYATGRSLHEVARDVVARRLRFDPDPTGSGHDGGNSHGQ